MTCIISDDRMPNISFSLNDIDYMNLNKWRTIKYVHGSIVNGKILLIHLEVFEVDEECELETASLQSL